jgi:hypothetical protein
VATGLDIFVISCINAAAVYALWPSNAQDAFRVYDGSVAAAMLAVDGGDGSEFHAALDEAYRYADMGGKGREYSGAV